MLLNNMKRPISLFIFVLFIGCLIGCSNEEEETAANDSNNADEVAETDDAEVEEKEITQGEELRAVLPSQPTSLDTHAITSEPVAEVGQHVFETLLAFDSNDEIQPMLADRWEFSEDSQTLTFHLREGVTFHNGQEMTADDVAASFDRWRELSGLGSLNFEEATVEVTDPYTVVITSPTPMTTAIDSFAHIGGEMLSIMPEEIVNNAGDSGAEEFIGTGPFKFENWVQDQQITLTKFEDYVPRSEETDGYAGKREALVNDLHFIFASDPATQVAGLQTGEYDVVHRVPMDMLEQVESSEGLEVQTAPLRNMRIYFNKRNGIFEDQNARKAVSTALDLESILIGVYNEGNFRLEHNLMGDSDRWYSDAGEAQYNVGDFDKATEFLEDTEYDGEPITLLASTDYSDHHGAGIIVQEQLQQFGLNVELGSYDWPTVNDMRNDENAFDMVVQTQDIKPGPHAQPYLDRDYPGWTESDELDEILDRLINAPEHEEALEHYDELQEWFYDYTPIVHVGILNTSTAYHENVKNIQFDGRPYFLNVSIEE